MSARSAETPGSSQIAPSLCSALAAAVYRTLLFLGVILIAYGSLMPLVFTLPEALRGSGDSTIAAWQKLALLSWRARPWSELSSLGISTRFSDLLLNLLLYLPLGVTLRLWLRHSWVGWVETIGHQPDDRNPSVCLDSNGGFRPKTGSTHPTSARFGPPNSFVMPLILIITASALMSYSIEFTQQFLPGRVGSWYDVLANTAGGAVGAMTALWLEKIGKQMMFAIYRKISGIIYTIRLFLAAGGVRKVIGACVLLLVVGLVCVIPVAQVKAASSHPSHETWLPFIMQFKRSYDVAATQMAGPMFFYLALALLIHALLRLRGRNASILFPSAMLIAIALTRVAMIHFTLGLRFDLTEPALALIAAVIVAGSLHLAALAVSRSCRRRQSVHVTLDRRRF